MAARKREKGKLSGIKQNGDPSAAWRKFKERLAEYESVPFAKWKAEQFFGHICKRYNDHMGMEFTLSYSGPPTKCKEIYCIRRMMLALGTEDPVVIKAYIDWVFDTHIIPKKITLTSVAFFFTEAFIHGYKTYLRKSRKITRTTQLPTEYESVAQELDVTVSTYGDLAFAKMAIDQDPANEDYLPYQRLFERLMNMGFDPQTLLAMEA